MEEGKAVGTPAVVMVGSREDSSGGRPFTKIWEQMMSRSSEGKLHVVGDIKNMSSEPKVSWVSQMVRWNGDRGVLYSRGLICHLSRGYVRAEKQAK